MQPATPDTTQENSPLTTLELIKDHFTWVSTTIAALASLAGVSNLILYTNFIGRPDILLPSLEFGPSLGILFLVYILIFTAIVGSMLITSYVFTLSPSLLRPKPEHADSITRWLFGMTVGGMLGIVAILGIASILDSTLESVWWLLFVFLLPAILAWPFIRTHIDHAEFLAAPLTLSKKLWASVTLIALVGFTATLGIYPAWYVTVLYEERSALSGSIEGLFFCLVTMAGSLVPAVAYYSSAKKGKSAQIKSALVGLLIFLGILTLTIPPVFSVASMGSASLVGLSDLQVRRYLIDSEKYPANSLDESSWAIKNDDGKKYTVEAFSLYTFGPITLLCPADLRAIKSRYLGKHTERCIPFKRSAIEALDAVEKASSDSSE
jgi:MFS family permease